MSRRVTLLLLMVLSAASIAWAALVLFADETQRRHRDMIAAIHAQRSPVALAAITTAIVDIEHAMRRVPCSMPLSKQRVLLLAYATDRFMQSGMLEDADNRLDQTHTALQEQLVCAPMDGKAWLDLATIAVHREGFTAAAAHAYRMSARVAPGESWLAQKRLEFALKFRALFDDAALDVAGHDIVVLQLAHPIRMHALLKLAEVKTPEELAALFH
jgi:hypothetical protein